MKIPAFTKHYEERCVLDFPGFDFEPGKVYGVIGANGCGKTTFAKILSGTLAADQRIALPSASIGYMPQKSFAFRMTTRSNILLGGSDKEKADRLIDAFHLGELADKRADKLSGGETARMAMARIMMRTFDLVILDEPTASMDMESTLVSEQLIRSYVRETGCALILITHSLQQARRLTDEILFFSKGELKENGSTTTVLDAPQQAETRQFLEFFGV